MVVSVPVERRRPVTIGPAVVMLLHNYRRRSSNHRRRASGNSAGQRGPLQCGDHCRTDSLILQVDQIIHFRRPGDALGLNVGDDDIVAQTGPRHRHNIGRRHRAGNGPTNLAGDIGFAGCHILVDGISYGSAGECPCQSANSSPGKGIVVVLTDRRADAGAAQSADKRALVAIIRRETPARGRSDAEEKNCGRPPAA